MRHSSLTVEMGVGGYWLLTNLSWQHIFIKGRGVGVTFTLIFWRPKLKTTGIYFPLQVCDGRWWCCRGEGACWTRHAGGWGSRGGGTRLYVIQLFGATVPLAVDRGTAVPYSFCASNTQRKVQRKNKYGNMVSHKKNISFFQVIFQKQSIYIKSNGPFQIFPSKKKSWYSVMEITQVSTEDVLDCIN